MLVAKNSCKILSNIRMLLSDVSFFRWVLGEIVEFDRVFQTSAIAFPIAYSNGLLKGTFIDFKVNKIMFYLLRFAEKGWENGDSIRLNGDFGFGNLGGGRHEVDVVRRSDRVPGEIFFGQWAIKGARIPPS